MKTLVCFVLLLGSLSIFADGTVGQKENPDCDELLNKETRPEGEKKEEPRKDEDKKKGPDTTKRS